jgi:Domain of unknown function (DUF4129)
VQVDLREALSTEGRAGARKVLVLSVVLAVIVVLAAGVAGTVRLSGPRWLPHIGSSHHTATAPQTKIKAPKFQTRRPPHTGSGVPLGIVFWIILAVLVLLLLFRLWLWWSGRPEQATPTLSVAPQAPATVVVVEPEPEPDPPVLLSGIELALRTLDEHRDPADAIVRAWLGLQETAEESGIVRQASETPTEFTSRILKRAFADDRAVQTLLRLYLRTRFGDHPVTADDVAQVRAALSDLVRGWRADEAIIRR